MKSNTPSFAPVFYDIETSGLDGVPIEVGWAFASHETGEIETNSLLIRPAGCWQINSVWSKAAERLHGISIQQLRAEGHSVGDVACRMNEALDGLELFSDAPG